MSKRFEVGNIVRLHSGSPKMTVTRTEEGFDPEALTVYVAWFVNDELRTARFPIKALVQSKD